VPPNDIVFHLVPPCCEEHISSVYAELESPGVEFESFWQVYNQVHNAVDKDFLFEAATTTFDEENASGSEELDANQLPLHYLPMNLAKTEFPLCSLYVTVKPTIYYAFLLPNLSSSQNILQTLMRKNLVQYP
jgi:hypothetical protein